MRCVCDAYVCSVSVHRCTTQCMCGWRHHACVPHVCIALCTFGMPGSATCAHHMCVCAALCRRWHCVWWAAGTHSSSLSSTHCQMLLSRRAFHQEKRLWTGNGAVPWELITRSVWMRVSYLHPLCLSSDWESTCGVWCCCRFEATVKEGRRAALVPVNGGVLGQVLGTVSSALFVPSAPTPGNADGPVSEVRASIPLCSMPCLW
jgi:hypothetical protein